MDEIIDETLDVICSMVSSAVNIDCVVSTTEDVLSRPSSTISRSDSVDSIEYQVDERKEQEEPIVRSDHQVLYVTPNGDVRRPSHVPSVDEIDDRESVSSDEESDNFLERGEHLEPSKRKVKLLEIDRDSDFCHIETITYNYDGNKHKYHYIKSADIIQGTGLKPQDELISVNDKELTDRSQKKVREIFKRIRPKHGKKDIQMKLTLRRWKKSTEPNAEDVWTSVLKVKIWLTLVPVHSPNRFRKLVIIPVQKLTRRAQRRDSEIREGGSAFKVSKKHEEKLKVRDIKLGCIHDIEVEEDSPRLRLKIVDTPSFLLRASGQLTASVLPSDTSGVYNANVFKGMDDSQSPWPPYIFGLRLYESSMEGDWFLTSNLQQDSSDLCFKVFQNDDLKDNLDERCFLFRRLGANMIFESLLYREHFLHCNASTKAFCMKRISMTLLGDYVRGVNKKEGDKSEQFREAERQLEGCWFTYLTLDEAEPDNHTFNFFNLITKLFVCGGTQRSRTLMQQMSESSLQSRNTSSLKWMSKSPV